MLLREIKPLHFGFYKKKFLKIDNMAELYTRDELINDINVLKTIAKYSKRLCISRRAKGFITVFDGKSCIKFKPNRTTCYDITKIFKKFVDCNYLDCLIMNVEGIYYSLSRLNEWEYGINLYYSLDNNYKDCLVEDVFDDPSILLDKAIDIKVEDKTMFKLEDLDTFRSVSDEDEPQIETVSIDVTEVKKESESRTIKTYKRKESGVLDMFKGLFVTKVLDLNCKHTIKYGIRESDKLYCKTQPVEPLNFNDSKNLIKFLTDLIAKVKTTAIEFIEINCDVLIYIIKNNKGISLFSNCQVDHKVSDFIKDFHNVFLEVIGEQTTD